MVACRVGARSGDCWIHHQCVDRQDVSEGQHVEGIEECRSPHDQAGFDVPWRDVQPFDSRYQKRRLILPDCFHSDLSYTLRLIGMKKDAGAGKPGFSFHQFRNIQSAHLASQPLEKFRSY
jgi:hypothetical protein